MILSLWAMRSFEMRVQCCPIFSTTLSSRSQKLVKQSVCKFMPTDAMILPMTALSTTWPAQSCSVRCSSLSKLLIAAKPSLVSLRHTSSRSRVRFEQYRTTSRSCSSSKEASNQCSFRVSSFEPCCLKNSDHLAFVTRFEP